MPLSSSGGRKSLTATVLIAVSLSDSIVNGISSLVSDFRGQISIYDNYIDLVLDDDVFRVVVCLVRLKDSEIDIIDVLLKGQLFLFRISAATGFESACQASRKATSGSCELSWYPRSNSTGPLRPGRQFAAKSVAIENTIRKVVARSHFPDSYLDI